MFDRNVLSPNYADPLRENWRQVPYRMVGVPPTLEEWCEAMNDEAAR
jgi:hypothetical protein